MTSLLRINVAGLDRPRRNVRRSSGSRDLGGAELWQRSVRRPRRPGQDGPGPRRLQRAAGEGTAVTDAPDERTLPTSRTCTAGQSRADVPLRPADGKVDPKYSLEARRRGAEPAARRPRCRWRRDCVGPEVERVGRGARARARCCCWRTSASTPRRRQNDPAFAASSWPRSATSTSTTPSARPTGPMPRRPGIAEYLPRRPAC